MLLCRLLWGRCWLLLPMSPVRGLEMLLGQDPMVTAKLGTGGGLLHFPNVQFCL